MTITYDVQPQRDRLRLMPASELESAPRAVVRLGAAPDGLPWLLEADRSYRLQQLVDTVLRVFELERHDELPERVRVALERDVASGLMGVHDAVTDGGAAVGRVYVSRQKLKRLLGPTLLSQILEPPSPAMGPPPQDPTGGAKTNVGALAAREGDVELVEAVERSIHERRAKRHLVLRLSDGAALSASVQDTDRVLRTPRGPFRPLVLESLASVDAEAVITAATGGEPWRAPVRDPEAYARALLRAHQSPYGGATRFRVPRARLVAALAAAARVVAELHRRELVHADVAPGNLLLAEDGPTSFDSLDVAAGSPATAATFEWAAPEQIVGLPVDPRTDVFALGKIATAIMGGVIFGEETSYVVPVGGERSRRVRLLKSEGVFVDISDSGLPRQWQLAWQGFLGRCVAHDAARRPPDAQRFADELAELAERHAPTGHLEQTGRFGNVVPIDGSGGWSFARLVAD